MYPNRFFPSNNFRIGNNFFNGMIPSNQILHIANKTPKNIGIFSKITNGFRSLNWGGLLNNANKTLNVVNQAIPLVRQAGPMVNNMKSMIRIAKAFGSETTTRNHNKNTINKQLNNNNLTKNENKILNTIQNTESNLQKKEDLETNVPNFFI